MIKNVTICLSVIILMLFVTACTDKREPTNPNFIPEYTESVNESDSISSDTNTHVYESEKIESNTQIESIEESDFDAIELTSEDLTTEATESASTTESTQTNTEGTECPHVDTLDENGYCDICGEKIEEIETDPENNSEEKEEDFNEEYNSSILFNEFYDSNFDLTALSHSNGSKMTEKSDTYTQEEYELKFLNYKNVYKNARDAMGNPALKVGNTTDVGSFEINLPNEISIVVFEIAKYKDHTSTVFINGREYSLTKNSNDGEYERIIVDATKVKTITFTTADEGKICMVRAIEYIK